VTSYIEDLAAEYNIESLPTFVAFKDGKKVAQIIGGDQTQLQNFVQQHCG